MKKYIASLLVSLLIVSQAGAYSPFDIVLRNAADLAVSDIYQDTASKDMYLRVCNVGGDMTEAGTLLMGIRKSTGYTLTNTIEGITMSTGACRDFRVGSVDRLGVVGTESATFTAAIKLTRTKNESNLANNKMVKYITVNSVGLTNPTNTTTPWTPWNTTTPQSYGAADFTVGNIRYEQSISAYQDTGTTMLYNVFAADVCNNGDGVTFNRNFQVTFSANNRTEYVTLSPYYNSNSFWTANECRTVAVEVSKFSLNSSYSNSGWYTVVVEANTGYDKIPEYNTTNNSYQTSVYAGYNNNGGNNNYGNTSIRVTSPNGGETFGGGSYQQMTIRGELTSYGRNVDWVDFEVYRKNRYSSTSETLYTSERLYNSSANWNSTASIEKTVSIYNWPDDEYRIRLVAHDTIGNTTYDWSDGTFIIGNNSKQDIAVESIWQDYNSKNLTAHICNRGFDMTTTEYITMEWYNTNNYERSSQNMSLRLNANQCIDTTVSPWNLNIRQDGRYTIRFTADSGNQISETNRDNNTLTQELYIRY